MEVEFQRFEELVADAQRRLWRAYVAARGPDGADEAVSEALVWAVANRDRLVELENPIGYLYRVGLTRSSSARQPLQLPAPEELRIPDVEPGLVPALLQLTEKQRTAVWLVHACDWTYAEVARALGVTESTVGTHVSRALVNLRRQLEAVSHE